MNDKSQAYAWLFLRGLLPAMFVVAVFISGCAKHASTVQAIPRGATVLVLGDSISYGVGAEHGAQDYPTLLASQTGWQVINAGVPGDVSSGGLARLPGLLEKHRPRLVIIELGGNDFLRHMASSQAENNLESMVRIAQQAQVQVVLIAIPSVSFAGSLTDHPIYAQVANDTGALLVTDVVSKVLSDGRLRSDQIHPNAEGYQQVADGLIRQLRELGVVH